MECRRETGLGTQRPNKPVPETSARADGLAQPSLEEPYAGNLLVRVRGGAGVKASALPGIVTIELPNSSRLHCHNSRTPLTFDF